MQFSKTTKEINSVTYDALYVDRQDTSIPQSFTRAELMDMEVNTENHEVILEERLEPDDFEYEFYLDKNGTGKSKIDRALEEQDSFLDQCDALGVV